MSYLIDTNILSEVRKGVRCDANVAAWWKVVRDDELWISVLLLGEIRKGAEKVRNRDQLKAAALDAWIDELTTSFQDRILPVNSMVADEWGRISAIRSVPVIDALLAATAITNDLAIVTRNVSDMAGIGVRVVNPFSG